MKKIDKEKHLSFTKLDIDIMYAYIHKDGNKYDGLAYLYSVCDNDKELNRYIMTKINYDTVSNSLDSEKFYEMMIIAMNNFEKKYRVLLGNCTMFTVNNKALELAEQVMKKYPEYNYDDKTKMFDLEIDKDKIEKMLFKSIAKNIIDEKSKKVFYQFGLPITTDNENLIFIQRELGELGVSIYQKYYEWYRENGLCDYTDYIDSFIYGNLKEINGYLDEIIAFTEKSKEMTNDIKLLVIEGINEYKEKLLEYEKTKDEQEV